MSIHTSTLPLSRRLALAVAGCAVAFAFGGAHAADRSAESAAQAQYKRDLADCDGGGATEARATCRTEAMRAYQQAKAGDFNTPSDQLAQNARARCDALKGIDRTACIDRMSGRGSAQGSVGGGGILRESTVTVPAR